MDLLLLTADPNPEAVLPSLSLLAHTVRTAPTEVSSLMEAGNADVALVDARAEERAKLEAEFALRDRKAEEMPAAAVIKENKAAGIPEETGLTAASEVEKAAGSYFMPSLRK